MSITEKDIGKRVKYRTAFKEGFVRRGVLIRLSSNVNIATVDVDPDEVNKDYPTVPKIQHVDLSKIELDYDLTKADVGKFFIFTDTRKRKFKVQVLGLYPEEKAADVLKICLAHGQHEQVKVYFNELERIEQIVLDKTDIGKTFWLNYSGKANKVTLVDFHTDTIAVVENRSSQDSMFVARHELYPVDEPQPQPVLPIWQSVDVVPFPKDRPILMLNAATQTISTVEYFKGMLAAYWKSNGVIFSLTGITHWAEVPGNLPQPKPSPVDEQKKLVMKLWSDRMHVARDSRDYRLLTDRLHRAETKLLYLIRESGDKRAHYVVHGQALPYRGNAKGKGAPGVDIPTEVMVDLCKDKSVLSVNDRAAIRHRLLYLSQQLKLAKYKP